MVEALAQEYKDAVSQQRPQAAERAFTKFMKAHGELAKALKQVEAGRTVRSEFRKTIPRIVQEITAASIRATLPLIRQYAEQMRSEVGEYVRGNVSADELLKRLLRYEVQLPNEVAARMKAAMTGALKSEEATITDS